MRVSQLSSFRVGGRPLRCQAFSWQEDHVMEGVLRDDAGTWYAIERGVPCFLRGVMRPDESDFARRHGLDYRRPAEAPPPAAKTDAADGQARTAATFSDKWRRFRDYGMEPSHQEFLFAWYCKKLGLPDVETLRAFYRGKQRILEVGPGSGFNCRFMAENTAGEVFAADISEAADTTFENTRHLPNVTAIRADLMDLPFPDDYFDFIVANGVLHHTPDTRRAVKRSIANWRRAGSSSSMSIAKWGRHASSATGTSAGSSSHSTPRPAMRPASR